MSKGMDPKKLEELFIRFCKPKNVQSGGFITGAYSVLDNPSAWRVRTCQLKPHDPPNK